MPEDWKVIPLNAGLLAALISGVAATVLGVYVLQSWVDSRVRSAVDNRVTLLRSERVSPIERRVDRLENRIENLENRTREDAQSDRQIERLLEELVERREREPGL